MRNITTFAMSALALVSFASAEVAGTFSTGYHSNYIFRGLDSGNNESLFDYALDFTGDCGCGLDWNAGLWYGSTDAASNDELDLYASVSKEFDYALGTADLALGYVRYTYPQAGTNIWNPTGAKQDGDGEIFLSAATELAGLALGATYYLGDEIGSSNQQWIDFSAGYGFDITEALSATIDLGLGYAAADGMTNQGIQFYSATVGLQYALSEAITLSGYFTQQDATSKGNLNGIQDESYGGAALSFAF